MKQRRNLFLFILAGIICLPGCRKLDMEYDTPPCLFDYLNGFKQSACTSGAEVDEYEFQGKLVYVSFPGSCERYTGLTVNDSECNIIGSLGGCFGSPMVNGANFSSAKYQRIIWKN